MKIVYSQRLEFLATAVCGGDVTTCQLQAAVPSCEMQLINTMLLERTVFVLLN